MNTRLKDIKVLLIQKNTKNSGRKEKTFEISY